MHWCAFILSGWVCLWRAPGFRSGPVPMTKLAVFALMSVGIANIPATPENATFDSAGALTALIDSGSTLPIHARLVAVFDGGVEVELQPHDQRTPITRDGRALQWTGAVTCPNGTKVDYAAGWTTQPEIAVATTVTQPGDSPASFRSIDYVLDLPREVFVGGQLLPSGLELAAGKPADAVFFQGQVQELRFAAAAGGRVVVMRLDRVREVCVTDRWDAAGRSYRVRIRLHSGALAKEEIKFGAILRFDAAGVAVPPVKLTIDAAKSLHDFDGFGANYCWGTENAVTDYTLANLRIAWSRHELKALVWDQQKDNPGPVLTGDFERIRGIHQSGVPWIISLWRLPERFYTDPNRVPAGTFGRKIAGERWPALLDLIGSYLLHLKNCYGAEPALFSFNEPDLGVDIGLTPEEHRDAVKRIGGHFEKLGLRTRFLLGDTANPRDSHKYVLATAADADAMRFVGAVSAHSWGGGTPEQYRAWSEVAAWLRLPLIIGEAGTDPGSWRNKTYDSYTYGLGEAKQVQELLRHARPQSSLYWQFTADYGLARLGEGGVVEPTGRFWLMKHITNLTPHKSAGIETTSDRPDVLISAFVRGDECVVHLLNIGPACDASVAGLPPGNWRTVTTTETAGFQESSVEPAPPQSLRLPARSLTTLVRVAVAPAARGAP